MYLDLFIFNNIIAFTLAINTYNMDLLQFPDYDYHRDLNQPKTNLRERFLKSKKEMKLLNQYSLNNTVYLNGIAHYEINKGHRDWNKVNKITTDLRKILAADGVEYIYKRDYFWRTWRRVIFPDGVKVICYKCNAYVNATCKECNTGSFWSIEEDPPCPFELFSMVNGYQICAANITQPYNYNNTCPSKIKITDITRTCDNPIITKYRITKLFDGANPQSNSICGEQDYCEISTFYKIDKEFISFRVTNSSNDVLYSKIMKSANKNYYCLENCGSFSSKTNNVVNDKPLSISLITSHVNKRENEYEELNKNFINTTKIYNKSITAKGIRENIFTAGKKLQNEISQFENTMKKKKSRKELYKSATVSPCTKLSRQFTTEDYEENYVYQEYGHKFIKK